MPTRALYHGERTTGCPADHDAPSSQQAAPRGFYRIFGKRLFDLFLVVLIAPIVLPLIIAVTLVLLVQGVAPFYSQARIGKDGSTFRIWKFRTMHPDADRLLQNILDTDPSMRAEWEATQKLKHDPRVTAFGLFLRKTSIDELPQLWNVLVGQMSLLGPRPMMPEQQHLYGPALPVYTSLRPGISGVWQVSERNDSHFLRRAELDIEYARNLSFATDLRLVGKTLRTVLYSTGY
ncbi:sugar transferase [Natronohydrobacter thiooxidans]|jgi:exopolysaccharide production protein ExoY|uniref:sugar transferase n=1 Tax=Natronohydrobacter thiooxidans TaxID=87172 RepID=UPI0009FE829B|nr:sugar transferase [Natronohydrobacter thiooxidans]